MSVKVIAPCGIDCSNCYMYNRSKNACPGCRGDETKIPKHCSKCRIRNCSKSTVDCKSCKEFPCKYLKTLDRHYRKKYNISPLENLQ